MIKKIIKHTKPVPADVWRNDYFNHQRLHLTLMLKLKNKQMKKLILSTIILLMLLTQSACSVQKSIAANDRRINYYGSRFVKYQNGELILHRHSDKVYQATTRDNLFNPLKARSGSGIKLEFKTASPHIKLRFKIAKGWHKNPVFSVFQNGNFQKNYSFVYGDDKIITLDLQSETPGEPVVYTITYPIRTDVHFLGMTLDEKYKLLKPDKKKQPVYVAFGNSITHGTGQQTTPQTYAYQLAEKTNWELYNLAVGGSKTSPVMAEMIRDDFDRIDYMTILTGFNDYNGAGVDTLTFANRYRQVLSTIRETHPDTKIYIINLTTTKIKYSKTSGIPIEDFRKVIRNIVKIRQAKGDKNIFLIEGKKLTSEADLNDNVHLSVEGSRKFAEKLYHQINSL